MNVPPEEQETAVQRFRRSMEIDYEKWHDGVGYDLDALRAATADERAEIETILIGRGGQDWRDVEALAALDTPRALRALKEAFGSGDDAVRAAVLRHAPGVASDAERAASLVRSLETAGFYGGLTQALDLVAGFHPPEVVEALVRGVLRREGEVAVHYAAMLLFVHGKADDPFDMEQRPFFLRFNTGGWREREAAFRELCLRIGTDPEPYLSSA